MSTADLIPPHERTAHEERFRQILRNGSIRTEVLRCRKDGTCFPVELSARSIEIEGKRFVQAIVRDITERKRTEAVLRASEQQIRPVLDVAAEGVASAAGSGLHCAPGGST